MGVDGNARVLTEAELQAKCKEWQRRLRLQDWSIKVRVVRKRDMKLEARQAAVEWVLENKTALISILDPIDYPVDGYWPQDQEQSLVHELLHLHIAPFDNTGDDENDLERIAKEQAIDALAWALVELARGVNEAVK